MLVFIIFWPPKETEKKKLRLQVICIQYIGKYNYRYIYIYILINNR